MTENKIFSWINEAKRLCGCKENHLNCMEAKAWTKAMIGVWEFKYEPLDIRDKKVHPATFPIALARKVIELFTHQGNVVLDPFNGSGTTLLACRDLSRNGIGIDLNKDYCDLAKSRLSTKKMDQFLNQDISSQIHLEVINDDSLNLTEYIPSNSIDLAFTSPPMQIF